MTEIPDDAPAWAQDMQANIEALNRSRVYFQDRVDELDGRVSELESEVADLLAVIEQTADGLEYDSLDRDQKIFRIRKHLIEAAAGQNGRASIGHKEVKWLFDGRPSKSHIYDLMAAASAVDGFEYRTESRGNYRLTADIPQITDTSLSLLAKTSVGEVRG